MLPDSLSAVLLLALSVPAAPVGTGDPGISSPVAVTSFRFRTATLPPPSALARGIGLKPLRHVAAKKATAAVAGGILGFMAGLVVGAGMGALANGEDGAMVGFTIGAPAGAAVGGVMAVLWAR
jgi:hypothetical protein